MSERDTIFIELPITQLLIEDELPVPTQIDQDTCEDYAVLMAHGASIPLKVVRKRDGVYTLDDDWHILEAYRLNGKTMIPCAVTQGDAQQELMTASTANIDQSHHLRSAETRSRDRAQANREREAEIARRSQERDTMLDHDRAPAGLPPPVPDTRYSSRRGKPAGGQRRSVNGGKSKKKAVTPSKPPTTIAPLLSSSAHPTSAALATRQGRRNIKVTWAELDDTAHASLGDLSEVPNEVLALVYHTLGNEISKRPT